MNKRAEPQEAIRLYAIPLQDGKTALCSQGLQTISNHYITNPTPADLQVMASREYPQIKPADWYVEWQEVQHRWLVLYTPY